MALPPSILPPSSFGLVTTTISTEATTPSTPIRPQQPVATSSVPRTPNPFDDDEVAMSRSVPSIAAMPADISTTFFMSTPPPVFCAVTNLHRCPHLLYNPGVQHPPRPSWIMAPDEIVVVLAVEDIVIMVVVGYNISLSLSLKLLEDRFQLLQVYPLVLVLVLALPL
ncbi:hypothetical protein Cgig2_002705 [Carnegiea gigantea]|uniref:Uncharacterized protein n=1 Tax=Carnegiea gigantea TaxID=171969 RepID=A0A9Q1KN92_9CARY|nr:hypothetical protein Cgig2_002705 [Carnegiea gigantea]